MRMFSGSDLISFLGVIIMSLSSSHVVGQKSFSSETPIIQRAYESYLYRDEEVDWQKVEKEFVRLTTNAKSTKELEHGLNYLINAIGDKHGTIRLQEDYGLIASYKGPSDKSDRRISSFINEVINDVSQTFSYRLLDQNVGYLRVVGISPQVDISAEAQKMRSAIKELKKAGVSSWIVDLRYNGGGTINPMLAGLAPLLGDGSIGGQVDVNGESIRNYKIQNGKFVDTENVVDPTADNWSEAKDDNVAILLSRYTVSSGEFTAAAFKGRPNTIFIGEKSAGYTTATGWDMIGDDLLMCISVSLCQDRTGKTYTDGIDVDIPIPFHHSPMDSIDNQVVRAINWLVD